MVGTKESGNPWQYHMNPEALEGAFIQWMCAKEKQGMSTWTFKLILLHYEKEAREYFGDAYFEKLLKKHSATLLEQSEKIAEKQEEDLAEEPAEQNSTMVGNSISTPQPAPEMSDEKRAKIARIVELETAIKNHKAKHPAEANDPNNLLGKMVIDYQKQIDELRAELKAT